MNSIIRLAAICLGLGDNRVVRVDHALLDRENQLLACFRGAELVPAIDRALDAFARPSIANCFDRERTRHLARCMATHAVADDQDASLGIDEVRIFVVIAHFADARLGGSYDRGPTCHRTRIHGQGRGTCPYPRIL